MKKQALFYILYPLLLIGLSAGILSAQTEDEEDGNIFELSPFQVDESETVGYYSSQTLAGGRLTTALKDIATSVQVVTHEFMQDIGATQLDEVLAYTTATEAFGSLSDYQQISAGLTNDDQQRPGDLDNSAARQNPDAANRVRGMTAPTRTTNYFASSIPFDSYNASRIDINRGANSFLFGLGSPGGIVNTSLQGANLYDDSVEINARISTEEFEDNYSHELSINFNKVLIEDKLAIRIAAKERDQEFMQKPAFIDQSRQYAALELKPFDDKNIFIKANFERGETEFISVERNGPLETLSTWIDNTMGDQYGPVTDLDGNVIFPNSAQRMVVDVFGNIMKNSASRAVRTPYTGVDANGVDLPWAIYRNQFLKRNGWMLVYDGTEDANGLPTRAVDTGWTNNRFRPGSPTWDPFGNYAGPTWATFQTTPRIAFFGTSLIGRTGTDWTRWNNQGLLDYDVFDFRKNLITGRNDLNSNDFDRTMLSFEAVTDDGNYGISLDYAGEDYGRTGFSLTGSPRIDLDINYSHVVGPNDLFGDTNPNLGRLFFYASASDRTFIDEERSAIRATAFARIDFDEKFDEGFLSKLGRHTLSLLADEDEFNRSTITTEPLVMGNNADFHLSTDANIFQREGSAIFYISEPYLNAFDDPGFQLSDFHTTGLNSNANVHLPEDHQVPLVFKSEGDPNVLTARNGALAFRDQGTYTSSFQPVEGNLTATETSSQALNLQSFFFDDLLVANLGWRRDEVGIRRFNAERTTAETAPSPDRINISIIDPSSFNLNRPDVRIENSSAENFGYGLVLRIPSEWLPEGTEFSLHLGENSNFVAAPGQFDWYGNNLPGQEGTTREYGFTFSAYDNGLVVRVTRYEGDIENDAYGDASFAYRVFTNVMSRQFRDLWEARNMADENQDGVFDINTIGDLAGIDPDMNKNGYLDEVEEDPNFMDNYMSLDDFNTFMAAYEEVWSDFVLDQMRFVFNPKTATTEALVSTAQITTGVLSDTSDLLAEGYEVEVTANPTRNLRFAFSASQGTVTRSNVAGGMGILVNEFRNAFESVPQGPRLSSQGNPLGSPLRAQGSALYPGNSLFGARLANTRQAGAYYLGQALDGSPTPEQSEWNFRFVGNYSFDEGRLAGFNVGGAYRWTDESAIGYPNLNDPDVPVIIPDVTSPFWGDSQGYADLWIGYRSKLFDDKVDWRIQLNVRNVFRDSDPVPIQTQPDGSIARMAIPVPRSFVLSNTFSF